MGHTSWSVKRRGLFFQMQTQAEMYKKHGNKEKNKNQINKMNLQ